MKSEVVFKTLYKPKIFFHGGLSVWGNFWNCNILKRFKAFFLLFLSIWSWTKFTFTHLLDLLKQHCITGSCSSFLHQYSKFESIISFRHDVLGYERNYEVNEKSIWTRKTTFLQIYRTILQGMCLVAFVFILFWLRSIFVSVYWDRYSRDWSQRVGNTRW